MANEHIGRLHKIAIGRETTSGTAVAATDWIPKSGGKLIPAFDVKMDEAAYGVIDANREGHTVKEMTKVTINGEPRDKWFGHLLHAAFGQSWPCVKFGISGITGTFSEGETITESVSSATGVLRRNDQGAGTAALYIVPSTGTFTGAQVLTGGTSGATATGGAIISPATGRHHIFRRLNNNTHPTYTIYNNDPLEDFRAAYCILDSLNFECIVGDFAKFAAVFMGKAQASTSAQTPTYNAENSFLAKFATFKVASNHNSLDAASALAVKQAKFNCAKNAVDFTAFASTAPTSLHNQKFEWKGDFTLLYNETTERQYLVASTKRAIRITIANTDAAAVSGSTYPTLQLDFPVVTFHDFDVTDANDTLREQTLGFVAEYDITRALTAEAILINTRTTTY